MGHDFGDFRVFQLPPFYICCIRGNEGIGATFEGHKFLVEFLELVK